MKAAIITAGGIGDAACSALQAATLMKKSNHHPDIYVNSHQEITDFINKCTEFDAYNCPPRCNDYPHAEDPRNLPTSFLDKLKDEYDAVYSCCPDSLFRDNFAFPWTQYAGNYREFMQTKVKILGEYSPLNKNKKHIFMHMTSVNMEKNYPLPNLQTLVQALNKTEYEVVIARTSSWKGLPIPFFINGKFIDLVDSPIEVAVSYLLDCDYCISIDSAFSHIAYHAGVPRLVLQQHVNLPLHQVRYHLDALDDIPLLSHPDTILNRVLLNLREPLTYCLPAYMNIPHTVDTKQLLYLKYD